MVLQRRVSGFREEFSLKLLIADCGPILVREVPFLKGPVRDGQREFPVFRFHGHNPVAVVPAAGLQLKAGILDEHAHGAGYLQSRAALAGREPPEKSYLNHVFSLQSLGPFGDRELHGISLVE